MFRVGDRVQTHPATDHWMRGDRFGTVEKIGRERETPSGRLRPVHVRRDVSGRVAVFHPDNVIAGD